MTQFSVCHHVEFEEGVQGRERRGKGREVETRYHVTSTTTYAESLSRSGRTRALIDDSSLEASNIVKLATSLLTFSVSSVLFFCVQINAAKWNLLRFPSS